MPTFSYMSSPTSEKSQENLVAVTIEGNSLTTQTSGETQNPVGGQTENPPPRIPAGDY